MQEFFCFIFFHYLRKNLTIERETVLRLRISMCFERLSGVYENKYCAKTPMKPHICLFCKTLGMASAMYMIRARLNQKGEF